MIEGGIMIRFRAPIFVALLALAVPLARAQSQDEARPRDLERLQEDLANLDAEMQGLEPSDSKADTFRQRAEDIREDLIYLKVKMRRQQQEGGPGTGVLYDEVADVRRSIANLREDIESAFGQTGELRLPEGTQVLVRIDEPLSSKTARREDRIEASVFRPVSAGEAVAIPAGTRIRGVVRDVVSAERPSRGGRLELEFDSLYLDSERIDIRGSVAALQDEGHGGETAGKAGIGAVLGGVLGGILGGGKGAAVGVIAGGTGAVVGTKGDDVELPAGSILTVRLERAITIHRR
jgi:hypothetical protein